MAHTAMRKAGATATPPSALLGSPRPSFRGVMPRLLDSRTVTATASPAIVSSPIVAGVNSAQLPDGGGNLRARVSPPATMPAAKNAMKTPSTSRYARRADIGPAGGGAWIDHQCGLAGLPIGSGQSASLGSAIAGGALPGSPPADDWPAGSVLADSELADPALTHSVLIQCS